VIQVALIGDGQLARGVASALARRRDLSVIGPTPRESHPMVLRSGADVVVIATTTLLHDVIGSIETAVAAGSNVIVSAEEAAYPWAVDAAGADRVHLAAIERDVTVLGCGLNPGFVFDAQVLTLLGAHGPARRIEVSRVVDLSGFGPVVAARLGLGVSAAQFEQGVHSGAILGHAGFTQSIALVAHALGMPIDRFERSIEPIMTEGVSAGVSQTDVAIVAGEAWFEARFVGHRSPATAGLVCRDEILLDPATDDALRCLIEPGIRSQAGSQHLIANSIDRVLSAPAGWLTVADLPPARPVVSTAH
jgi:4-hydroxy-tetrahydrodipicolinate reductase